MFCIVTSSWGGKGFLPKYWYLASPSPEENPWASGKAPEWKDPGQNAVFGWKETRRHLGERVYLHVADHRNRGFCLPGLSVGRVGN